MISWPEALDLYEASLEHHQRLVDGVDSPDGIDGVQPNPWPPAGLPTTPIPEASRERAADLLERSFAVMDAMAAKMADVPPRRPNRSAYHPMREPARWTATL